MSTREHLGAGIILRIEETRDGTERVTLIFPDGSEDVVVGGHEHESPEDMIWRRRLEGIFRAGLEAGITIGKSLAPAVGAEGGAGPVQVPSPMAHAKPEPGAEAAASAPGLAPHPDECRCTKCDPPDDTGGYGSYSR